MDQVIPQDIKGIILKILKDQTQLMEHWVEYHTSQAKTSFHLLTNNITKELIRNCAIASISLNIKNKEMEVPLVKQSQALACKCN